MKEIKNSDNIEIIIDSDNNLIIDFNLIEIEFDIPEFDNPQLD